MSSVLAFPLVPAVSPLLFIPCSFFFLAGTLLVVPHLVLLAVACRFMERVSPAHWEGSHRSSPPPPLAAVLPPVPGACLHGGASPLLRRRDRLSPGVPALAGRGLP